MLASHRRESKPIKPAWLKHKSERKPRLPFSADGRLSARRGRAGLLGTKTGAGRPTPHLGETESTPLQNCSAVCSAKSVTRGTEDQCAWPDVLHSTFTFGAIPPVQSLAADPIFNADIVRIVELGVAQANRLYRFWEGGKGNYFRRRNETCVTKPRGSRTKSAQERRVLRVVVDTERLRASCRL
jgi:hypothetical protein